MPAKKAARSIRILRKKLISCSSNTLNGGNWLFASRAATLLSLDGAVKKPLSCTKLASPLRLFPESLRQLLLPPMPAFRLPIGNILLQLLLSPAMRIPARKIPILTGQNSPPVRGPWLFIWGLKICPLLLIIWFNTGAIRRRR